MELNDYIMNSPGLPPVLLKPVTTSNDPDPLPVEKVVKPKGGGGPWPFKDIPDPRPFDNEEKVI